MLAPLAPARHHEDAIPTRYARESLGHDEGGDPVRVSKHNSIEPDVITGGAGFGPSDETLYAADSNNRIIRE